jgi:nicotinamidase-related amidase
VPGLGAEPTDYVSSRRHGVAPFTGTPLHSMLEHLGVRVLIVSGVSVNLGVLGLCIEAVNLGYQVVVATDAVAGVPADYGHLVLQTSVSLVASLYTVDEIARALGELG